MSKNDRPVWQLALATLGGIVISFFTFVYFAEFESYVNFIILSISIGLTIASIISVKGLRAKRVWISMSHTVLYYFFSMVYHQLILDWLKNLISA